MGRNVISAGALAGFVVLAFGSIVLPDSGGRSNRNDSRPPPTSTTSAPAPPPAEAVPPTPPPPEPKIGDTITFGDSQWRVTGARSLGKTLNSGNRFVKPKQTSGHWVRVDFEVKNLTKREQQVWSTPKLKTSEGATYETLNAMELIGVIPEDRSPMMLEKMPAGITKQFTQVYEVPVEAEGLTLEIWEISKSIGYDSKSVELGL